jgi:hypothetical protein
MSPLGNERVDPLGTERVERIGLVRCPWRTALM